MNFTKEQIDYIKKAVDHVDFLTGGSRNSKTKQIIEELQQENARLKDKIEKVIDYANSDEFEQLFESCANFNEANCNINHFLKEN